MIQQATAVVEPQARRWTKDEFHLMAEAGLFEGQRAELIEGEVMVQSPPKAEHFTATDRSAEVLRDRFGAGFHVRMQGPIDLGAHSEPEPDVAVVTGSREDHRKSHPRTAALIVEVSDTTLESDRTRKASLYARAGIADYWIVNLVARQVEVYRQPVPDPSQAYGPRYADATVFFVGMSLSPLAKPGVSIDIADLLG